jgi:hypothetical protein
MAVKNHQNVYWRDYVMTFLAYSLLGFVLAYLVFSVISYALPSQPGPRAFGMISEIRMPTFADLRWITSTSGCHIDINDMYLGKSVGCDSFGRRGIGYPPMSLWASRFLRIKGDHTPLISLTVFLSFIGVVLSQVRSSLRSGWLLVVVSALFLISFPVQLGLERMNLDVIIFLLIYLAALLFSFQALVWLFPLVIFVVAMKYYPCFAFFALALKGVPGNELKPHWLPPWIILLIASFAGLALSLPWASSGGTTVAAGGLNSHGLLALGYINNFLVDQLGLENARWAVKTLILIKLVFLALGAYMAYRLQIAALVVKAMQDQVTKYSGTRLPADFYPSLLVASTAVWLGCYVITISFDYRMIFLFPILIFIARAIQLGPGQGAGPRQRTGLIVLLISMLGSMLIPLLAYSFSAGVARVAVDGFSEFVLIPFYASALSVIILNCLLLARRSTASIAEL